MPNWICALVLLALVGAPGRTQAADEMKTFSSAAGHFTIHVPGTPKEEKASKTPGAGDALTHTYSLVQGEAVYILSFTDFAPGQISKGDPQTILRGARDGAIKNAMGTLVSDKEVSVGGFPGRSVVASVPVGDKKGTAEFKLVLVKSRLYLMLFIGPEASAPRAEIDEFLSSLNIVADEPQDGWKTFTSAQGKFSIRMPGTPVESTTELSQGIRLRQYALDKGAYAYIVSFNGIGGGAPAADAVSRLLDKGRDSMVANLKGKLVEERAVTLSGNPGKAIRISVPAKSLTALVRSYIVGDQYYQVMLIGAPASLEAASGDRYFASFQFTGPIQAAAVAPFKPQDGGFTIDFPGAPKMEKVDANTVKYLSGNSETAYVVVVVNAHATVTDPDKITGILEGTQSAEMKTLSGKLIGKRRVGLGDVSGLEATFSIPDAKMPGGGTGIERFYFVGTKVYEVAVISANTRADESNFAHFFDSFKVAAE